MARLSDSITYGNQTITGDVNIRGLISVKGNQLSINTLSDGYNDTSSVGLGTGALAADDGTTNSNTAVGTNALNSNTTGANNTAHGNLAGSTLTTGANNTLLGNNAQPSTATVSNEITLGDASVTSLRCNVTTITALSDKRDKVEIADIPYGLDFINAMRPVKFAWDRRDGSMQGQVDLGFIAQELDQLEQQFNSSEYTRLVHKENPDRWEADPMKTYPIIVKAIQELSEQIAQIQASLRNT